MKLVIAMLQPFRLDEVTRALGRLKGVTGMTTMPCQGFGRERPRQGTDRLDTALGDFSDKVQVEVVTPEEHVGEVVNAIVQTAHSGRYGDGLLLVVPVERAIRLSTLEEGETAV